MTVTFLVNLYSQWIVKVNLFWTVLQHRRLIEYSVS